MAKLNDIEIAQCYVGKPFNDEKLKEIFDYNMECRAFDIMYPQKASEEYFSQYIATCFHFNKEIREKFGITPLLHERWGYAGIDFSVMLYVVNGEIKKCNIYKCRDTGFHSYVFHSYVLTPSQQEIRIFRRIMDYITQ